MAISIDINWNEALRFTGQTADGRLVELNSGEKMEKAHTPMELFLFALAGCTAMDVIWILEKQRQKVEKFQISARGTRRDDDPRYYEAVELEYRILGREVRKEAVERAIRLSQDKYCSVRAMVNSNVNLKITYRIQDADGAEQVFNYSPSP